MIEYVRQAGIIIGVLILVGILLSYTVAALVGSVLSITLADPMQSLGMLSILTFGALFLVYSTYRLGAEF